MNGHLLAVSPPTVYPVTTAEVADYLRLDEPQLDVLEMLIDGATAYLDGPDGVLNRALCTQTWDYRIDGFPSGGWSVVGPYCAINIPLPPLKSVTSVTYTDTDGVEQTWANTEYVVDLASASIYPAFGKIYPAAMTIPNSVTVRFVAGESPDKVSSGDKMLVIWLVKHWHEHREPFLSSVTGVPVPEHFDRVINARRRWAVA